MRGKGNSFGIQKVKEQDVRSNLDIASSVGSSAATGAKIGKFAGPYGAIIGAAAFGTKELMNQGELRNKEKRQNKLDKGQNKFVESLSGRDFQSQYYSPVQMKKGMKSKKMKGKYKIGEIEGDGSGSKNGIGEIHTDKNFNPKTIAQGGKTHNQGGVDVEMEKGDVVFNTQNNKKYFDKIKSLVNRVSLNNDKAAKKELEKIRQTLPSEEDYKNGKVMAEKGNKSIGSSRDYSFLTKVNQGKELMTSDNVEKIKEGFTNNKPLSKSEFTNLQAQGQLPDLTYEGYQNQWIADEDGRDISDFDNLENSFESKVPTLEKNGMGFKKFSELIEKPKDNIKEGNPPLDNSGKSYDERRSNEIVDFITGNQDVKNPEELAERAKSLGIKENELLDTLDEINKGIGEGPATGTRNSTLPYGNVGNKTYNAFKLDSPQDEEPIENAIKPNNFVNRPIDIDDPEDATEPEEDVTEEDVTEEDVTEEDLASSNKEIDKVIRRFYSPEELNYKDLSYNDRRTSLENRNFRGNLLRGKGLSSGQQQGYMSQIGSSYKKEQEAINEREAQRYQAVEQFNTQGRNQAKLQNLGLANEYDTQDAQSEAVKKAYGDTAYKEMANLAESETRQEYMKDRDERAFEIQEASIPLYGTGDYDYKNGKWYKTVYNRKGSKGLPKKYNVEGEFQSDGTFKSE
jgi:hypothetical protein